VPMFLAIIMLSYPAIKRLVLLRTFADKVEPRLLLFICGGNTCRPLWPRAVAREEIAMARAGRYFRLTSGRDGQNGRSTHAARGLIALGELGIEVRHRARVLTPELCRSAQASTADQAHETQSLTSPQTLSAGRFASTQGPTSRPARPALEVYRAFAVDMVRLVRCRLAELPAFQPYLASGRLIELLDE